MDFANKRSAISSLLVIKNISKKEPELEGGGLKLTLNHPLIRPLIE